jgi:hypothetical protein
VELESKVRGYVAEQLTEATFQQFIASLESFLFDFLRLWLLSYPQSLGARRVEFRDILAARDIDAVKIDVVNREVLEVAYKRPAEWFKHLESKIQLGCPSQSEIEQLTEAKATRDVLVHNRGVANNLYIERAGALARFVAGQRIDVPEHYHREIWSLLRKIVADMGNAAITRVP